MPEDAVPPRGRAASSPGPMWRAVLGVAVLSALLTVFSETLYWYQGGTGYPERVLVYLIPTTALVWVWARYPALGWPAVVLGGAVFGFVTEGVLTPVVYGGYPFDPFAISYTSLAWHALISVGAGLVLLHRVLAGGSRLRALAVISLLGAFWAAWAMSWRLPPDPEDELADIAALTGDVTVGAFALYTVAATVVVAICHALLGTVVRPADVAPRRAWLWVIGAGGLAWFATLVVPAVPWAPFVLAALLLVCRWGLVRAAAPAAGREPAVPSAGILASITERIPVARLGLLAALPVAATAVYALLVSASLSDDTIRLVFREGIVAVQVIAGWALFLSALWRAWRTRPLLTGQEGGRRRALGIGS